MADSTGLSVVIAGYTTDRFIDIQDALESMRAQTCRGIEVVFVVDGSTDLQQKMQQVSEEFHDLDLRIVFNDGERGLSRARNLGVSVASGNIIAFIDDDAIALPDWAEETVKTFTDSSIIGVTGPSWPLWEDESMSWFPQDLEWVVGGTRWFSPGEMCDVKNVWGTNMSFRREIFDAGIRFSSAFGLRGTGGTVAEETDISLRVRHVTGKRIVYNPRVKVRHKVTRNRLSWSFIARRSYQIGRSRRMIAGSDVAQKANHVPLGQERHLLVRILARLLPDTLCVCLKDPLSAWRRFSVTLLSLSSVFLGYVCYLGSPSTNEPVLKEVANNE